MACTHAHVTELGNLISLWLFSHNDGEARIVGHCEKCEHGAIVHALGLWATTHERTCTLVDATVLERVPINPTTVSPAGEAYRVACGEREWDLRFGASSAAIRIKIADTYREKVAMLAITKGWWTDAEKSRTPAPRRLRYYGAPAMRVAASAISVEGETLLTVPAAPAVPAIGLFAPVAPAAPANSLDALLECYVCSTVPVPPWHMCAASGHVICKACLDRLEPGGNARTCGVCRTSLAKPVVIPTRFITAFIAGTAGVATLPCGHDQCAARVAPEALAAHRETCARRPWPCVEKHCPWRGTVEEMVPHAVDKHTAIDLRSAPSGPVRLRHKLRWLFPLTHGGLLCIKSRNYDHLRCKCVGIIAPMTEVRIEIEEPTARFTAAHTRILVNNALFKLPSMNYSGGDTLVRVTQTPPPANVEVKRAREEEATGVVPSPKRARFNDVLARFAENVTAHVAARAPAPIRLSPGLSSEEEEDEDSSIEEKSWSDDDDDADDSDDI